MVRTGLRGMAGKATSRRRKGLVGYLVGTAALVLIAAVVDWRLAVFLGAFAVTFLVAASPLYVAARLVARSLDRGFGSRQALSWARVGTFLAGLLIAFVLAYLSYRGMRLMLGVTADEAGDPYGLVGAGVAMGLFVTAVASAAVLPLTFLGLAVVQTLAQRKRGSNR